jgi:energy-coupling factor transporter ATP-binding protein EcfA2
MRKLTVKNFSVIKEAELEFGKITVLIGPQASGKSLLCKLAYFLSRKVIDIAIDRVVNRFEYGFPDFEVAVQKEFTEWFPRGGWGNEDWSIIFSAEDYEVTISVPSTSEPDVEATVIFNESFKSAYQKRIDGTIQHQKSGGFIIAPAFQSMAATEFFKTSGRGVFDRSIYIPVERSYLVDTMKGFNVLRDEPDPIFSAFAPVYQLSLKTASKGQRIPRYLKGSLIQWQSGWMLAFQDDRFLPLNQLSSGSKETLPILSVLDYYEDERRRSGNLESEVIYGNRLYFFDDFTIEEPESSVFPQTQYDLVRELASLSNETNFQPHFTVTTHSPYILTAFNDLIKAGYIAVERPERASEIEMVIPRQYWIRPGDFAAYAFDGKDGILRSILDDETKMINGDILDDISSNIADEFGKLLEIQYGGK